MSKIQFPKDFLWGGAVSAEQTEGHGITKKGKTTYDILYSKKPENFFNDNGPSITTDAMTHYKEDIKMWKDHGLNSHRTSISWARVFPDGMDKPHSQEALDFYHKMFDEMIKQGIKPMINLYHFDMPEFGLKLGGFESRKVWDWFLQFAKLIFHEFAGTVKMFSTMNEPWVPIHLGYLGNRQLPQIVDPKRAVAAANGIVMCHAMAVNYFNDVIKKEFPDAEMGSIFNCATVYPRDPKNPKDVKAAMYSSLYSSTGLTDPMVIGKWRTELIEWIKELDLVPDNFRKDDLKVLAKVHVDFVGLNFYAPNRARAPEESNKKSKNVFLHYFSNYDMPGKRENKFRGWEIYPKGIYDTLHEYVKRYGKDMKYMLTEYGMGVQDEANFRDEFGIIQDDYRISFVQEHLEWLHKAMDDGIKVIGAHMWATYDCWSFDNAFKNTYGLFEVDLKTMKRRPKKSALWFKEMIKTNSFETGYKKMEDVIDFSKLNIIESKKYDPLSDLKDNERNL